MNYTANTIDPNKMYPVAYTIKQDGTKVYENTFLKGEDLTEKQIEQLNHFASLRSVSEVGQMEENKIFGSGECLTCKEKYVDCICHIDFSPKTDIEAVKDAVAKEEGFANWKELHYKLSGSAQTLLIDKIAIRYANSLLPVPNTKTVEGEEMINFCCRGLIKSTDMIHSAYCIQDCKQSYSIPKRILDEYASSLRSNEPEREGKEEDKTFNIAEEIHRLYKEMPECNLKKHLQKWFELDPSTVPSPPLKALSEEEISNYDTLKQSVLEFEKLDEQIRSYLYPILYRMYDEKKLNKGHLPDYKKAKDSVTIRNFGINKDQVFAQIDIHWRGDCYDEENVTIPVFYPVPEVKEKGE